jgi:shikimate dehydrogenase
VITGQTRLLGVIGSPIAHTLSPLMHNAAIADLGLDYVYLPFAVPPDELPQALRGFAAIGVEGFSVTIPHKQAIMPLLTEVSEVAQAIGAVNTVWRTPDGWSGTNTDGVGFVAPLCELQQDWHPTIAVILGMGGAARAVVAGCAQLGCAEIHVVGRDAQRLEAFRQSWQHSTLAPHLHTRTWDQLPELLPYTNLLVNATPIGMHPEVQRSPLSLGEMDLLMPDTIAYDLIYTPSPTLFLQQAKERELEVIDGSEMLVQQGAAALELWLQQPVPIAIMRQALQQHLWEESKL